MKLVFLGTGRFVEVWSEACSALGSGFLTSPSRWVIWSRHRDLRQPFVEATVRSGIGERGTLVAVGLGLQIVLG